MNDTYPKVPIPLSYRNTFTLLVSVLLSAQCTDVNVNNVTKEHLYPKYNQPKHFVKLGKKKNRTVNIVKLEFLGSKLKSIYYLSKTLVEEYNGTVPSSYRRAWRSFLGVGHKTASVVMSQGFGSSRFSS